MNGSQFIAELEQFKKEIQEETEQYVKDVSGMMLDLITDGNPLDTGKCTASWTASVGSPVYNQADDVTPQKTISRADAKQRSMNTLESGLASYKLGDTIYLANGTDYVSRLEQEPGYVQTKNGHAYFVGLTQSAFSHLVDSKINIP